MATDPVCGMYVNEKTAKYKSAHKGETYYFCSEMCKTSFDKNPSKYADGHSGGHSGHSMHSSHCC